ncbi:MAG: hypothetical protein IJ355_06080 [Prevotella sp.]|jgi:meiotically up-regulated gene 157 (Mug157) protein|nr:hypothetical protein [Prevotella sp.]
MSATINPEALAAALEFCYADALENNIRLMEESIDFIIDDDSIPADERIDLVSAYRRLGKQFRRIHSLITDKPA